MSWSWSRGKPTSSLPVLSRGCAALTRAASGCRFTTADPASRALLGPDVCLRQTRYDVDEAIRRARQAGDPGCEVLADLLMHPPTVDGIVLDAERRVFSE